MSMKKIRLCLACWLPVLLVCFGVKSEAQEQSVKDRTAVQKQEQVLLRKPRLSVTPVGQGPAVETAASVEMEPGEVVLMPGGGGRRLFRSSPDRWYKVTMR